MQNGNKSEDDDSLLGIIHKLIFRTIWPQKVPIDVCMPYALLSYIDGRSVMISNSDTWIGSFEVL